MNIMNQTVAIIHNTRQKLRQLYDETNDFVWRKKSADNTDYASFSRLNCEHHHPSALSSSSSSSTSASVYPFSFHYVILSNLLIVAHKNTQYPSPIPNHSIRTKNIIWTKFYRFIIYLRKSNIGFYFFFSFSPFFVSLLLCCCYIFH